MDNPTKEQEEVFNLEVLDEWDDLEEEVDEIINDTIPFIIIFSLIFLSLAGMNFF